MGKIEIDIKDRYESLKQKVSGRKHPFDNFIQFLEKGNCLAHQSGEHEVSPL